MTTATNIAATDTENKELYWWQREPEVPAAAGKAQMWESKQNWQQILKSAMSLAAEDDFHPARYGVAFQAIDSKTLRLRATDGFGLSLVDWIMPYGITDWQAMAEPVSMGLPGPKKLLKALGKFKAKQDVLLAWDRRENGDCVLSVVGDAESACASVSGLVPDFQALIPTEKRGEFEEFALGSNLLKRAVIALEGVADSGIHFECTNARNPCWMEAKSDHGRGLVMLMPMAVRSLYEG